MADNEFPTVPAAPTVPLLPLLPPLTPGNQTSEYKATKSAGWINLLGLLVGAILSIGPSMIGSVGPNTKYAIIGGAIIGLAAVVNKTLLALGYARGQVDLKIEHLKAQAAVSVTASSAYRHEKF